MNAVATRAPLSNNTVAELLSDVHKLDHQLVIDQLDELGVLRLFLMTPAQLCELKGVGYSTAAKIRARLRRLTNLEPRSKDETAIEALKRLTPIQELPASLVLRIDLNSPAQKPKSNHLTYFQRMLGSIEWARDKGPLTIHYFTHVSGDRLVYIISEYDTNPFTNSGTKRRIATDYLYQFSKLLDEWGVHLRVRCI